MEQHSLDQEDQSPCLHMQRMPLALRKCSTQHQTAAREQVRWLQSACCGLQCPSCIVQSTSAPQDEGSLEVLGTPGGDRHRICQL